MGCWAVMANLKPGAEMLIPKVHWVFSPPDSCWEHGKRSWEQRASPAKSQEPALEGHWILMPTNHGNPNLLGYICEYRAWIWLLHQVGGYLGKERDLRGSQSLLQGTVERPDLLHPERRLRGRHKIFKIMEATHPPEKRTPKCVILHCQSTQQGGEVEVYPASLTHHV